MNAQALIETYGYPILVAGTFLEGEVILILGGLAAHLGYLKLPWVILSAFIGSVAGDQLYFFIGRRKGMTLLDRRPSWRPRALKVLSLFDRHQILVTLGFRFVYGMRSVTPFVLGASRISTHRYVVLNVISAFIWAAAFGTAGYLFGVAVETFVKNLKRYEIMVMAIIAGIGVLLRAIGAYRSRRRS